MEEYRDTDYGNFSEFDAPVYWQDDFDPPQSKIDEARELFSAVVGDLLEEIAESVGLDTDRWDSNDWSDFCDRMELYL